MVTEETREAVTKAKSSWLGNQTDNNTAKGLWEKYAYEITILMCLCLYVCVCVRARAQAIAHTCRQNPVQTHHGSIPSRW